VNERWLHSDWVEKKAHLWLDFGGGAPAGLPRLKAHDPLAANAASPPPAGEIKTERQRGQVYEAEFAVSRPGFALFKMSWHPNWTAYVDGKIVKTAMLSPGFTGVPVSAGRHRILLRYEPGMWKLVMALAGLLLVLSGVVAERRGYLARLDWVVRPSVASEPEVPAPAVPRRGKRSRR
jgi:hypothetical protein